MLDLKAHVFHGKSFHQLYGPALVAAIIGVTVITAASFFLNAVFAFAIARPGRPDIRPAVTRAWSHAAIIFGWGGVIGLMLGIAACTRTAGPLVVPHLHERGHRHHDGDLRVAAVEIDRHEDHLLEGGQAEGHGSGRG
jgi:hypothetical protein